MNGTIFSWHLAAACLALSDLASVACSSEPATPANVVKPAARDHQPAQPAPAPAIDESPTLADATELPRGVSARAAGRDRAVEAPENAEPAQKRDPRDERTDPDDPRVMRASDAAPPPRTADGVLGTLPLSAAQLGASQSSAILQPSAAASTSGRPGTSTTPRQSTTQPAGASPATQPAAPRASMTQPVSAAATQPATPRLTGTTGATTTTATKRPSAPPSAAFAAPPQVQPPPAVAPAKPAAGSVAVPRTDHVHVEVPAGLQSWLDADDRMRPWLGKAVAIVDGCYARERADNPNAAGSISFTVTMHENARPSGRPGAVEGPVRGIIMCATRQLMSIKMPLFTGKEGATYTVKAHFEP